MIVLPQIDTGKCSLCGNCVELCPTKAVELVGGQVVIVRPQDCNYCTECEEFCPTGAIRCPFEILLPASSDPLLVDKPEDNAP